MAGAAARRFRHAGHLGGPAIAMPSRKRPGLAHILAPQRPPAETATAMSDARTAALSKPESEPPHGRGLLIKLVRLLDSKIEFYLNFLFYAYLTSIIIIEVFRRYVLDSATSYGEETARYAFIWLAYVAAARGVKNRSHLSIEIVRQFLGRTGKFALFMLSDVCFMSLAVIVVFTSIQFVITNIEYDQMFTGADLPLWLATTAVPVGWSLIAVRVVQRNIATIADFRAGRPIEAGTLAGE
jgi:C4-dicarboxylate transporter, DctQ subunit